MTSGLLMVAVLALVIGAGEPATAAPELRLSPASGPPNTEFTITGTGFAATDVELHWDTRSGPLLATATGPDFTVQGRVPPDVETNSFPVVAVVRQGNSVSTSTASFQVTPVGGVLDTTTTTVGAPVLSDRATSTTLGAAAPSSGDGGLSRASSVTGGLDPATVDTTDGSEGPGAPSVGVGPLTGGGAVSTGVVPAAEPGPGPAGVGAGASAGGTPAGAAGSIVPGAAGAGAPASGPEGQAGSPGPSDRGPSDRGPADAALGPRPTSQSEGAVRSPVLLFVGLAMVFGAGAVLAVRNRRPVAPSSR